MTRLAVAAEVCAAFGDLRIDAIVAAGFAGRQPWPEVGARLRALEADAVAGAAIDAAAAGTAQCRRAAAAARPLRPPAADQPGRGRLQPGLRHFLRAGRGVRPAPG